jgi:15-cis-phytoene synthase
MADAFKHCEELAREADKDRFLATLFAPEKRRGALFALYAFNSEVARIREAVQQPMAGEIRLQWWRDALQQPGAREARSHPVASALLDIVIRYRLPVDALIGLIEARAFDLYNDPMPDLATLEGYVVRTSSTLIELAARILDQNADVATAARAAGLAYGITGLLRAFPLHAARGQLFVPLEVLQRHGARPEDVLAGRATPELATALAEMRDMARAHFQAYRQHTIPQPVASAFMPAELTPLYLDRLARIAPFRLNDLPQWRRQWALWRAARRM